MDTVHLMGSEEVANAGRSMRSAAEAMESAASSMNSAAEKMRQVLQDFDFTIMNHQRFMTSWVQEVRDALEEVMPDLTAPVAVRLMHRPDGDDGEYQEVEVESFHVTEKPPSPTNSDRPTMPSPMLEEEGPVD